MRNIPKLRRVTAALAFVLFLLPQMMFAQKTVNVTGTVSDSWSEPVIGATVIQKGTSNGVSTLADGTYSISVPEGAVLQFSCIGYKTVEKLAAEGAL